MTRIHSQKFKAILCAAAILSVAVNAMAQAPAGGQPVAAPAKATSAPASQPQSGEASLVYEAIAVQGTVLVAPIGVEVMDVNAWHQLKVGESVTRGQQIRTFFRSAVKLVARPADPPTVLMLETASTMTIEDLAIRDGRAVARLGLGQGAIRAGVAEGEIRSDMEISTPQAVLSKKGTDIFRFEYMNGKYNISLSEQGRGLLQAIQLQFSTRGDIIGSKSRFVTPGQYVTQRMAQAIESMTFDREININDVFGLIGNDRIFTLLNDRGFAFLLPFGSSSTDMFSAAGNRQLTDGSSNPFTSSLALPPTVGTRTITDGDFGVGQSPVQQFLNLFTQRTVTRDRQLCDPMKMTCKRSGMTKSRPRFTFGRQRH